MAAGRRIGANDISRLHHLYTTIASRKKDSQGLATFFPAMSAATCRQPGSNRLFTKELERQDLWLRLNKATKPPSTHAISRPKEAPGTIPGPPTRAAPMLDKMLPYKLGQTMVSNC